MAATSNDAAEGQALLPVLVGTATFPHLQSPAEGQLCVSDLIQAASQYSDGLKGREQSGAAITVVKLSPSPPFSLYPMKHAAVAFLEPIPRPQERRRRERERKTV